MFKSLVAKGHEEFSTNRQQDAYEFFQHMIKIIQQREHTTGADPTNEFAFHLQQRLQCTKCQKVRYSSVKQTEVSLPIPLEKAQPPLSPVEGESGGDRSKREAQSTVPLMSCVEAFAANESLEFSCPQCQTSTQAIK